MLYTLVVAAVLHCALSLPKVDLNQQLHLQSDIDRNAPIEHVFNLFKRVHKKSYSIEDEPMRKAIFENNLKYIKEHNRLYALNKKSYFLGVNQFTDLTFEEFKKMYTGHIKKPSPNRINATTYLSPANLLIADKVDWRDHGYVTPVKNQGQCGSCWSFSTTGSLEGQHFKKTGKLVSLSEQQLVDCSGDYGNEGCNGGLMDQAFEYIKANGGIEGETDYEYTAVQGTCEFEKSLVKATVSGKVDLPEGDEDKLKEAVSQVGPISIAIDASHRSFQMYTGGVYDEPECSSSELDHGVLVVGYGTDPDDYWLVKNSWGPSWGEEGYIKMARNKENQCGVASQASYPLV